MILWLAIAAMTALATALVIVPLLRRPPAAASRHRHDVEIYRDQLAEIERDAARGLLAADDAEAARAEVGRRMLTAADAGDGAPPPRRFSRGPAAAILAAAVPAAALALYLVGGAPDLPGRPAAENRDARMEAAAGDRQMAALVARLARRMEENPGDPKGWALLARSLAGLERYDEAVTAFARAVALDPGDAGLLANYGEALTFAGSGTVTPRARDSFAASLAVDASEPRARFYLGVADLQAGRSRQALDRWLALEAGSPPDAPWTATLGGRIDRLAASLNLDPEALRRTRPAPPGGSAAAPMAEADRTAMIESMVGRLAARLAEAPDDAEGWLRLGRSYRVLGKAAESRDAYGRAAALRPGDTGVLGRYAGSILAALDPAAEPPGTFHRTIAEILRLDPDHRSALWLAGLAAERAGKPAAATRYLRRLLTLLEPGSPEHARLARRIDTLGGQK